MFPNISPTKTYPSHNEKLILYKEDEFESNEKFIVSPEQQLSTKLWNGFTILKQSFKCDSNNYDLMASSTPNIPKINRNFSENEFENIQFANDELNINEVEEYKYNYPYDCDDNSSVISEVTKISNLKSINSLNNETTLRGNLSITNTPKHSNSPDYQPNVSGFMNFESKSINYANKLIKLNKYEVLPLNINLDNMKRPELLVDETMVLPNVVHRVLSPIFRRRKRAKRFLMNNNCQNPNMSKNETYNNSLKNTNFLNEFQLKSKNSSNFIENQSIMRLTYEKNEKNEPKKDLNGFELKNANKVYNHNNIAMLPINQKTIEFNELSINDYLKQSNYKNNRRNNDNDIYLVKQFEPFPNVIHYY